MTAVSSDSGNGNSSESSASGGSNGDDLRRERLRLGGQHDRQGRRPPVRRGSFQQHGAGQRDDDRHHQLT